MDNSFSLSSSSTFFLAAAASAAAAAAAAAASSSSAFLDFFGAPNALNHALKLGVADGLSVDDFVSFDLVFDSSVLMPTGVGTVGVGVVATDDRAAEVVVASTLSLAFSSITFSISFWISVDVIISSSSMSSESRSLDISSLILTVPLPISSVKLCC